MNDTNIFNYVKPAAICWKFVFSEKDIGLKQQIKVEDGDGYIEDIKIKADQGGIDFQTLEKINPDTAAWLWIPGTAVDYPVVYAEDNEKYMDTSFDGEGQASGTIFLDYESQRDFSGKHNIIYGHNMKNGSMFHDIVRFKEQDYFKDHQYGVLYTPERTIYLKMISAYYGEALPVYRKTEFATEEDFDLFLDAVIYPCEFGERPKARPESLYTFITCSYECDDARTYLHGVEIPEQEAREALGIQTEK